MNSGSRNSSLRTLSTWSIVLALLGACASNPTAGARPRTVVGDGDDLETYTENLGKGDTAYIGNQSYEFDVTATGTVRVPFANKTAAELETLAASLRTPAAANENSWDDTPRNVANRAISEQMKFGRNSLKSAKLDVNLEGDRNPTLRTIRVIEGGIEIDYSATIESLVKLKDLKPGQSPDNVLGNVAQAQVPLTVDQAFKTYGIACATDPDDPAATDAVLTEEVQDFNFWFYFNAAKPGCSAANTSTLKFEVTSSAQSAKETAYPEFDRLIADNQISMVAMFGQIEHSMTISPEDWGFTAYNGTIAAFKKKGFKVTQTFPNAEGFKLSRTFSSGLVVTLDIFSPTKLADSVADAAKNSFFADQMRTHEVVYFNGHAGYGSKQYVDQAAAYPENMYQVVFMDACWSYSYYTKQIFARKATAADPTGHSLVDVVNNTEMANTDSYTTSVNLLINIILGADLVKQNATVTRVSKYSWNTLVGEMNNRALQMAKGRNYDECVLSECRTTHGYSAMDEVIDACYYERHGTAMTQCKLDNVAGAEIYGASGVRDNTFKPRTAGR